MSTPSRHQAIVIGGSIAGLLTARVLADHFADVTIIDSHRSALMFMQLAVIGFRLMRQLLAKSSWLAKLFKDYG